MLRLRYDWQQRSGSELAWLDGAACRNLSRA